MARAAALDLSHLPTLAPACVPAGWLQRELAVALGADEATVVAVSGPDGSMGLLGAGAASAGVLVDVAGSTDVVFATTGTYRSARETKTLVNAYVLPELWTIGGVTPATGLALSWFSQLVGLGSVADLLKRHGREAMAVPIGSRGLVVDPALSGPRFPYAGTAQSALVGLTLEHGAPDILHAIVEGIAFSVREILEMIRAAGHAIGEVRLVGGGFDRWSAQLRADVWGVPVRIMAQREATLLGTAIAAAVASGVFPSAAAAVDTLVTTEDVLVPSAARADAFDEAFFRWQRTKVALGARHLQTNPT